MSSFIPRTSPPDSADKYYRSTSGSGWNRYTNTKPSFVFVPAQTTYSDNLWPNCTIYAWGRVSEIYGCQGNWSGVNKLCSPRNAGLWYNATTDYSKGQFPKVGAVVCWSETDGPGHVAVVEKIEANSVYISESSAYGYTPGSISQGTNYWRYHNQYSYNATTGALTKSGFTFQGYIYPDYDFSIDPQQNLLAAISEELYKRRII